VKKDDAGLFEAIKVIATTMSEQAKVTENEIHPTIERLISTVTGMLRDREAVLISDMETVRHQKEKELQLQKDELEFLLSGIRQAVMFSEAMMKEGSDTEIVAGHHQVVACMAALTSEREKAQLEPVADAGIEFVGMEESVDLLSSVIKELETVESTDISAEQSIIDPCDVTIDQRTTKSWCLTPTTIAFRFSTLKVSLSGRLGRKEMEMVR